MSVFESHRIYILFWVCGGVVYLSLNGLLTYWAVRRALADDRAAAGK